MFQQGDSRLCTKPGIQERGTKCGELGEWGGNVILWGVSSNVPENVAKHSGECRQTLRGISSNKF